jgi:hypothetical protein
MPILVPIVVVLLLMPGCTVTWRPDTLCQLPRPSAQVGDTKATQDGQAKAAAMWDRRCTLMGMWR